MSTDDFYAGHMLRRWSIDGSSGMPECLFDAVDVRLISADDREAIEAANDAVRDADIDARAEPSPEDADEIKTLRRVRAGEATDEDRDFVASYWSQPTIHQGPQGDAVNAERERRIAAGTTVPVPGTAGIPVQGREQDVRNLLGLGMAALARMSQGDNVTLTPFRDATNAMHDLTPPQVFALWHLSAMYASAVYQASWAIKAMTPIPADFADDSYWP